MNNEIEIPLDIDEATVEKLREAIGLKEIEERHNRFANGTETENDLLNFVPRFILKTDKGEFDIVQYKHYQKLVDLYKQEKEKNKELKKQYKILEVEKVRYNIFYLESNISQTPDTAMVYHSMKKHLETLKEEKIKLEAELQELLEE